MEQTPVLNAEPRARPLDLHEGEIRATCVMPYPLDSVPSQRFRWEQWAPGLRKSGVHLDFVTFATPELHKARASGTGARAVGLALARFPAWLREVSRHSRPDVLIVHRNAALAGPPIVELALRRSGVPFVYDLDDAIYLPPESGDTLLRRLLRADWRVSVLAKRASLVSVGSPVLADYVARHTDRYCLWPTTISLHDYPVRSFAEPAHGVPVIGWTGSHSTAKYLAWLLPVLREVQRIRPFKLLVVGATVPLDGLEGECIRWTPEEEVRQVHRMDIGLMPLPDTPWTRGKCALKALQYLAVGVPAIVSDVGVNRDAVPDGTCGYVVRSEREWVDRLLQLLGDPAMRRRMGEAGRRHVEMNYSGEAWAPRIADGLRGLAGERHERAQST